ncbi:hypothetical protein DPEC_G00002620 [Dallia pectoralis]|uniref:Uncharacterized protein n=1 Tax=Dallia pectoralis TaxID=75939 RepID=A0ACC2HJ19_DALPE|nr:hypothetical protein DPEC_G00002620 [Dallia pectoralis]
MTDHTYSMDTLHVAGGDGDVEEEMDEMLHPAKRDRINKDHTPIKQQQLKKMKPSKEPEDTYSKILQTMQVLSLKIDEQTELLKSFERRIEANSVACKSGCENQWTLFTGWGGDAASANYIPRPIIIQFGMRIVRDDVWKKSREARVCREMHIRFKEDFSKDDREARAKLWLRIQEARKAGKRAFLKEGYALIDNKRVDPD